MGFCGDGLMGEKDMNPGDVEYAETVKAIQEGIEAHERGEGVEVGEAFEMILGKLGLNRYY